MPNKALLIRNSRITKDGRRGAWHYFEEAQPYIQGIDTNIDREVNAEVMTTLVTGIPTPWARARLFGFAFPYSHVEANIDRTGLIEFYDRLLDEWKGLLACLAIFPERTRISSPIPMDPKQKDDLFQLPSALGRMLFEDADLWCNPDQLAVHPDVKPFIQLIYYQDQLIGATSPYSLVFTAVDYRGLSGASEIEWYREGAFTDPLPFMASKNDRLQKLYLLLKNMNQHFEEYEGSINRNRGDKPRLRFDGFKQFLRKWQEEVKQKGKNLLEEGTLDAELCFSEPYAPLFKVKQSLYFYPDGNFSFRIRPDSNPIEVNPQEILLQGNHIIQFREEDYKQPLSRSAIHYLSVHNKDYRSGQGGMEKPFFYFPLPLSEKGLLLFRNKINDLIGEGQENRSELRAYIHNSETEYKLRVELHLVIDDKKMLLTQRDYEPKPVEPGRQVIMWPNFVSTNWNTYYLYSEFPKTERGTQFRPFFKNADTQEVILDDQQNIIFGDKQYRTSGLTIEQLITYPAGQIDGTFHRYDIIRADKPFAGLEVRQSIEGEEKLVGYLLIKKPGDGSMGDARIKDYSEETNFKDVVVGIDFGSNNSCVQFARQDGSDVRPVPFTNRRVVLVGSEVLDPKHEKIALPHELYFFQNEEPENGQLKSWVHEHNPRYVESGMEEEEIAGGVPIFEPNIYIVDMDERTITTNAGTLHHSMKWLSDTGGRLKKSAYLKAVFLQTCADLYANYFYPRELRWSFPGSFSSGERNQYRLIYQQVVRKNPIHNLSVKLLSEPLTEAEAVANYANSKLAPDDFSINLGIDVGGSTSDILLIANDFNKQRHVLLKQSSLRLAAGQISGAIKYSRSFQRSLLEFHNNPKSNIRIPNIEQINTKNSPYYLNAIFDRLSDDNFEEFYSFLGGRQPNLFALPAFMTGLLLYYSGQLVSKVQQEHSFLKDIERINLFPFGKGGRIFDWLDAFPGEEQAQKYYKNCFESGYGRADRQLELRKINGDLIPGIRKDNKSEVAKGLVAATMNDRLVIDPKMQEESDLFGEKGFAIRLENGELLAITPDTPIRASHFSDLNRLKFPQKFEEFERFLDIFLTFVGPKQAGILSNTIALKEKGAQLGTFLRTYITTDPEFLKAKNGHDFEYKHSMLVLEGLCFMEKFLIPTIYQD